jgi:hypothetical protein
MLVEITASKRVMDNRNTNKKKWKRCNSSHPVVLHALMIVTLALLTVLPCRAAKQAFIRVNQYYVVYTMPIVPSIDQNGSFMVGLEGMTRGWTFTILTAKPNAPNYGHGTVTYDIATHTATLSFNFHTLKFRGDLLLVDVDGRPVLMKSAAIWDSVSGQMIVPLEALTSSLGLSSSWDSSRHVLSITHKGLTHSIEGTEYGAHLLGETGVQGAEKAQGQIVPETARLRFGNPPPFDPDLPDARIPPGVAWVELTVRNISSQDIGFGRVWLNVAALYRGDIGLGETDVDLPGPMNRTGRTPPVASNSTRMVGIEVDKKLGTLAPLCLVCEPLEEQ